MGRLAGQFSGGPFELFPDRDAPGLGTLHHTPGIFRKTSGDGIGLPPFFGTGGSLNYIGYSDADMDTLLTAARTAVGEGQTLLAYSSLQKKLAEELPYISIAYRNQAVFASKNIGGEVHPVESNVFRGIEAWTYQKGE